MNRMYCEICGLNENEASFLHAIKCKMLKKLNVYVYVCVDCDPNKYFIQDDNIEIRLYCNKGYTFDYEKEGDKKRKIIKTKQKQDYILINYFEAYKIYDYCGYNKIEVYENNKLKQMYSQVCHHRIYCEIELVPTQEFLNLRKSKRDEEERFDNKIKKQIIKPENGLYKFNIDRHFDLKFNFLNKVFI